MVVWGSGAVLTLKGVVGAGLLKNMLGVTVAVVAGGAGFVMVRGDSAAVA